VLSIPEVKLEEETPDDIVLVVINVIAPAVAVSNPFALELNFNPVLATEVTSKLLKLNLLNAIMILHTF
jgi:hypothetical protein